MYEYRQVIYRLKKGQSIRSISKEGIISRDKARAVQHIATKMGWLDADAEMPPDDVIAAHFQPAVRHQCVSPLEAHRQLIESWVGQSIQATVIYKHLVDNHGYSGSYNSVQRFAKKIKSANPTLTVPLRFNPGEAAQVDFGQGPVLFDERTGKEEKTWFFVMTLCWSRHQYVELVTHQDIETWLQCHQNAFHWFGGITKKIIIDNPKCAITRACYHDPQVQRSYEALAEAYGFLISACPPRDPKKKGRVEAGVKYVKKNFVPLRDIKSLQDGNRQLKDWILSTAGNRIHGTTFEKPLVRFEEIERTQLIKLPKKTVELAAWRKVSLYKNCHIRLDKCYYSAPFTLYNKDLWAKVTSTMVTIYHEQSVVATHPRLFKAGEESTQTTHLPPNAKHYLERDEAWCQEQALQIGKQTQTVIESFLTDPTKDLLRSAQSVIRLRDRYGDKRLEAACHRALYFNAASYSNIKKILKDGLDYRAIEPLDVFDKLSAAYQGNGLYQRCIKNEIH